MNGRGDWRGVRRAPVGMRTSSAVIIEHLGGHRVRVRCDCGREFDGYEQNVLEGAVLSCGDHPPADGRVPGEYGRAHANVRKVRGAPTECWACGGPAQEWAFDDRYEPADVTPGGYPYSFNPWHYLPVCIPHHRRSVRWHAARMHGAIPLPGLDDGAG